VTDIRIGCSGWSYDHWREVVYPHALPSGRRLEHYATLFDTVEVNATFYRLPKPDLVSHWVEATPDGFVFAVKASRYLTHVRRLAGLGPGVDRLVEAIRPLADAGKLGPILWQLPESLARDDDRLGTALGLLPPGRHAFEFRHASWFSPDVETLLRAHGAALVIADHPGRPFQTQALTTGWTYLRFHSGRAGGGRYSDGELELWAGAVRAWNAAGADVYAYFNNDQEAFAVANASTLRRLVRRSPL
jgi:uncharacterized protein YecE (DUF72 family)